jgi:hypothetical protein
LTGFGEVGTLGDTSMKPIQVVVLLALSSCSSSSPFPDCADAGVDGGCVLTGAGGGVGTGGGGGTTGVDPAKEHRWLLYFDDFSATVDITNLTFSDGFCMMSGGPEHSTFSADPAGKGTSVGYVSWSGSGADGSFWVEVPVTSSSMLGPQTGQSSPINPVQCEAQSDQFTSTYRMETDFASLTGSIDVIAPMPIDPFTGGNIGCPPKGGGCTVEYWFDNTSGSHRSTLFPLDSVFSGQSFTITFSGTAENTRNSPDQTGTGHYVWSGSMKLHAVQEF